jgi:hypothetical protein
MSNNPNLALKRKKINYEQPKSIMSNNLNFSLIKKLSMINSLEEQRKRVFNTAMAAM